MKLKITGGIGFGWCIGEDNDGKKYKVKDSILFDGETIQVVPYVENENIFIYEKMNYSDINMFSDHFDKDGLIEFGKLKEVSHKSIRERRIYELDGYWVFLDKEIKQHVEYLYDNNLIQFARIKIQPHLYPGIKGRAPIISLDYKMLLKKAISSGRTLKSWYHCERKKDFDEGNYADLLIITNFNEKNLQIALWQIIGDGSEVLFAHGFIDQATSKYTHFDIAYHYVQPEMLGSFIHQKQRLDILDKRKLLRLDGEIDEKHIFELIKMFFPLDYLVDEFTQIPF